jgi:hypothetical protein
MLVEIRKSRLTKISKKSCFIFSPPRPMRIASQRRKKLRREVVSRVRFHQLENLIFNHQTRNLAIVGSVSQIAVIKRPIFHYRRQTCGPASIELLSAQSSASSHGGKCSLQTKGRSSTYRLSCVRERSHAIDARSPPDVGRLRVVVRQLVPVLRHRQHPHGAE